ncbi:NAD(P)-dependent oxidoreductase [Sphingomonas jatrophae]|uniref:3-hydroxyisobutyrate dehydrogenase n=1 Tax=Sphingomonas jatrophae TaxID=1166337 RepID=A0A1I6LH20_9SPHN|nr:NAD(P)-dependent oxidoreductase [Sphingomonas jatrophae]SFS02598.1 3-hydroxyisobutyrate dehydrogenase [Sphingomonas jatrophae]
MAKLGFIGVGTLGAPIAARLAAAGHDVAVCNRTRAKAEAWVAQHGGRAVASPAAAAEGAVAVFTCVGSDLDLESATVRAEGCFRAMAPGTLFVDHSTVSARIARQLAVEGKDRGLLVLDAPVSGGESGAREGRLSVMCGGPKKAMAAAEPLFAAYAARVIHIGGAGAGQQAKMVNQIAIAGAMQGVAEAFRFAQKAGLDLDRVHEAVSGGAAASWYLSNRWATMREDRFDFGLAVDLMRKDLGLALDEARGNGAAIPLTALADQFYAEVQAMGGGRQDVSAVVRTLPE